MLAILIRLGLATPPVKAKVTLWLVPAPPPATPTPPPQPIQFRG